MGQEVLNSEEAAEALPDPEPSAHSKPVEYSYSRELLLSFADRESCKKRPENLDPVVWRDSPAADGAEGGIAIPAVASRGLVRRDSREAEAFSKSPVDIPEWRKDSWRSGGSGTPLPQGPRRKPYDEEPPGNAFSTSYPPRPAGNWGDNGHPRNYERPGLQGQGSGRWEHRIGLPEREREQGRPFQKWDGEDIVGASVVPLEALRTDGPRPFGSTGPLVRPGWLPAERDGLLGSGGGLQRTYTGNFTTPSTLRAGPERQMSMGAAERQMLLGPPERQMSLGLPERQMSLGLPERQNSIGRGSARNTDPYQPSRPLKVGPTFIRREETDFVNEETFGSENSSTDDRSEQERKRRESFELMRKDHQRLLQKQQKLLTQKHEARLANPESNASRKHDESTLWDSTLSSEGIPSSPQRSPEKSLPESDDAVVGNVITTPVVAQSTARPAIPPGFAKVVQQMQTTLKASPTNETPLEADNIEKEENYKQTGLLMESAALFQEKVVRDDAMEVADKLLPIPHNSLDKPDGIDSSPFMGTSESVFLVTPTEARDDVSQLESSFATAGEEKGEEREFITEGIVDDKKQGISGDDAQEKSFAVVKDDSKNQESLLDEWFSKSKSEKGSNTEEVLPTHILAEESQNRIKKENSWSEVDSKMSKFAQWFNSEENQSRDGAAVSPDILSLFPKGATEEVSSNLSYEQGLTAREVPQKAIPRNPHRSHGRVLPMPFGPSLEDIEKGLTENASSGHKQSVTKERSFVSARSLKNLDVERKGDTMSGIFGEHSPVGKFNFRPAQQQRQASSRSSPVFRTCEDIEQSMLAEAGTTGEKSIPKPSRASRAGSSASRKDGLAADSAASRHLLSLLQKGNIAGKHSPESSWSSHTEPAGIPGKARGDGYDWGQNSVPQELGGPSKNLSSDNPTLEALFGKAFMSELRSVEAPLSASSFPNDFFGNNGASQAFPGAYPVSRQSSGRVNNSPANSNVSKQWQGSLGPLASVGWMESDLLEANRHGSLTDLSISRTKVKQFVAPDKEDSHPVASGHVFWGNGVSSNTSDGTLPINTSVGGKSIFVSGAESTSFVVGEVTDSSAKGKGYLSRAHNPDLDMRTSAKVNRDGKNLPSGNFLSGQLRVSEDSSLPVSQGKVLSSEEPVVSPTAFDLSGLPQVFNEDGLRRRLAGDSAAAKFGESEFSAISREESTAAVSQAIDSFILLSRNLDRKEILEDGLASDKGNLGDNAISGNDRKMADSLSDASGSIGKAKDGNARLPTISTSGFPEQGNAGLARSNSTSMRFKSSAGAMQPTSGFSAFQPVGPPLQHQQSIGAVYRSDSSTAIALQSRQQSSIPVHHHLQQNPGSGTIAMFPQQFHPQPGLPQQQQLLPRTFSNGGSLEFPHVPFGHPPTAPSRPLSAAHLHFPPSPHGHLSPPGAYHPMGHMGPSPNHFLPPAQIPQRGPVMSPMAEAHMFMQEQSLHDPHGLGSKPGSQQGPPLFPLGGHALHSGQGPMYHQPLPHTLRGQQNQLLQGPTPWDLRSYSSELMRTTSKGHELSGFVNGNGGGVNSLDRLFGMELSRNVSGIPTPGLIQLSPHGLDAESKMRFG